MVFIYPGTRRFRRGVSGDSMSQTESGELMDGKGGASMARSRDWRSIELPLIPAFTHASPSSWNPAWMATLPRPNSVWTHLAFTRPCWLGLRNVIAITRVTECEANSQTYLAQFCMLSTGTSTWSAQRNHRPASLRDFGFGGKLPQEFRTGLCTFAILSTCWWCVWTWCSRLLTLFR